MESEKSDKEIAKKLWSIVRITFLMVRRSVTRSKLMLDFNTAKPGKTASKDCRSSYYSALTCRSNDIHKSFVAPHRHYEFSCSNTPRRPSHRKNHCRHREELDLAQRVLDAMEKDNRWQREEEKAWHQVDKDAEEFIKRFHKDLREQKRIAATESPSPYHAWAR